MSLDQIRSSISLTPGPKSSMGVRMLVQIVLSVYLLLFVFDTLNLDAVAGAIDGHVAVTKVTARYNSRSTQHASAFAGHFRANPSLRFTASQLQTDDGGLSQLSALSQDEETVGVQIGHTSASLAGPILVPHPISVRTSVQLTIPFDRIISFKQILI